MPPIGSSTLDVAAVKARQQGTWSSGDYSAIGTTLQSTGESLAEAVDIGAGELVLDVAAGNGNAALAAARRGGLVTATDYVDELLGRAGDRASADGLAIELVPADAERLPFDEATFDVVLSTFGVMFAPQPDDAGRDALDADLLALARAHDATAGAGALRIPSEHLEVVAVRRA